MAFIPDYNFSQRSQMGSIDSGVDAFLGAWSDSLNGDRWHGKIDDVRIWNTARTATQIQNNTNTQLTGNEAGLVANYSFDDGTTRDLTGNHHGTAHGVVLRTPSPSLSFDGVNDYVQTQDPFQNNENFTISLWVNPQVINDGSFHGFIGKQDGLRKPSMWVSPHNGALHYWTNGNTATNIGDQIYSGFINNFFTAANEWVHVTWVKDGSQYRFYRNGDLVHTGAAPARVYTNPNTSYQFGSVGNYFQGNLDDISIWDRALTNTEIKNNANTPLTGNEAGLVANYTFDDGTANDLTGNHHGITHGFVLRTPSPSLSLDGVDDYVEIPHSETVNFGTNDNFTVEVWVKADPNQLDLDNGDNDIIEKWDVNGGGYPFVIRYIRNTGQIIAARWDGSNAGAVTSTTNINDGNFHHIAFVKDGENLHLYVDGVLESTQTDNTSFNTKNNSSIYVGRRGQNQPFDNHFRGEVDELRIWNTARTQAEIQGNANQKLTGNEKKRISCLLSL